METVAQVIIHILRARGFRDSEIARNVNAHQNTICKIANGQLNGYRTEPALLSMASLLPLTRDEQNRIQRARLHLADERNGTGTAEPAPQENPRPAVTEEETKMLAWALMHRSVPIGKHDELPLVYAKIMQCTNCQQLATGNRYTGTFQGRAYVLCENCAKKYGIGQ